jgi:phytoene dehydrogenase-like protein
VTGQTGPLPLPEEVDGIVVGAGHNALVAAAYLAKAGLSVAVVETAATIGGGVTTDEVTLPLFKHNLHAFFVRWTSDYKIWRDLDLDRYGLRTIFPDVQNGLPFDGGERALVTYRDLGRSLQAIRRINPEDAESYRRLYEEFGQMVTRIEAPLRFAPPLPKDELGDLLSRTTLGRRYLEIDARSPLELVRDWFVSEPVRALVLFNVALRAYLPVLDVPGGGAITTLALHNSHDGRIIAGGSAEAVRAIAGVVYEHGGRILTQTQVASIEVANGRATGAITLEGRRIRARKFVLSGVPAPLTLLRMVDPEHLDSSLRKAMEIYRWNEEALFGVHFALARRPRFSAERYAPDLPRALNFAFGYEGSDDLVRDMETIRRAEVPPEGALHGSIPTLHDPSQAPPGYHTSFGWQFVPLRPEGRGSDYWDQGACETQMKAIQGCYERYSPDWGETLLAVVSHSPASTEARIPSMFLGDRHHGTYHPDNWSIGRPHPALSGYRTPIEGLYLCSSSQHPGGSFTGIPGYNAAGVIADDLGIEPWWERPDPRQALAGLT